MGFRIQIENKNIIERDGRASSSQAEVADSCNRPSLPARERRTNDDQGGARGRRSRSRPLGANVNEIIRRTWEHQP